MKKDVLIYFDLITSLKTVDEVNELSLELESLESVLFKSEKMTFEKAMTSIRENSAKKIMEIFAKNKLDLSNKEDTRDFLKTLKLLIQKFKIIKLILAFDPTYQTIEKIHDYIFENIGIGYILDIEVDETVLGGSVVIFNGKYKDFTLKRAIEEVFTNKNAEILKLIQ